MPEEQGITPEQLDAMSGGGQGSGEGLTPEQLDRLEAGQNPVLGGVTNSQSPTQQRAAAQAAVSQGKSLFQKLSGFFGSTVGNAAKFGYSATGKTVGGVISAGIGAGMKLTGSLTNNRKLFEQGKSIMKSGNEQATVPNLAWTALEGMTLGEGTAGKSLLSALKTLPGGESIAKGISEHLASLAPKLRAAAIEQYTKVFRPAGKEATAIAEKRVPQLLEQGIKARSTASLAKTAEAEASAAGAKVGDFLEAMPESSRTAVKPISDAIAALKQQYVGKVTGEVLKPEAVKAIEGVSSILEKYGKDVPTRELVQLRQIWDEGYRASKGITGIASFEGKAERAGANAIREELAKANPDLSRLNQAYSFWRDVADLAKPAAKREAMKSGGAMGVAGAVVGAVEGSGAFGKAAAASGGFALGKAAQKVLTSAAWRTISATAKYQIAKDLAAGDFAKVEKAMRAIATAHNIAVPSEADFSMRQDVGL